MKIGIDIDDVITNTSEVLMRYVVEHRDCQQIQAHMKEVMKGNPSVPEVKAFCTEAYLKTFKAVQPKDNAKEVINRWHNQGHQIYLITARGEDNPIFRGAEEVTQDFLAKYDIKYDKLIFNALDKATLCLQNQIDVMVDDSVEHCESAQQVGVKSLLFTTDVNKNIPTDIERVDNWLVLASKLAELAD